MNEKYIIKDEETANKLLDKIIEIKNSRPKTVRFNKRDGKFVSIEYDGNKIEIENEYGNKLHESLESLTKFFNVLYDEHIRDYADTYERKF